MKVKSNKFTSAQCPICLSQKCKFLYVKNKFNIFRCSYCLHVFVSPLPSEEEIKQFYDNKHKIEGGYNYFQSYGTEYSPAMQEAVEFANKNLSKNASILDIGCGTGILLKLFQEQGFSNIVGCEISPEVLKNKVRENLDIRIGNIQELFKDEQFDFITAIYVFEHILNLSIFLNTVHRILKKDGFIFAKVPNIYGLGAKIRGKNWSNMKPPQHLNYFSKQSLQLMFLQKSFKIVSLTTPYPIPHHLILGNFIGRLGIGGHLRIIARKR